jgi:hypothetical protein
LAPTVGIAATGFCYPGGILQVFIDKISKFRDCQEQQSNRYIVYIVYIIKIFNASPSRIVYIVNISYHLHRQDLQCFTIKNRRVHPNQWIARRVADTKEIQSDMS